MSLLSSQPFFSKIWSISRKNHQLNRRGICEHLHQAGVNQVTASQKPRGYPGLNPLRAAMRTCEQCPWAAGSLCFQS